MMQVEVMEAASNISSTRKQKRLEDTEMTTVVCNICTSNNVKYRCPRCERITCSLQCCLAHKNTYDCNGKRDTTKYIALNEFTDANLSSDYFFLEEIGRSTNTAVRARSALNIKPYRFEDGKTGKKKRRKTVDNEQLSNHVINSQVPSNGLVNYPKASQILVQHAKRKGISLVLMALGMSKRRQNTSYVNVKENKLYWRLQFQFPSALVSMDVIEDQVCDSLTLYNVLSKYLTKSIENAAIRSKLRNYAVENWQDSILLLLRKEFTESCKPQYFRLNGFETIETNLKRKTIVEFPTIIVDLKSNERKYPVAFDRIEVLENFEKTTSLEIYTQNNENDPNTISMEAMDGVILKNRI